MKIPFEELPTEVYKLREEIAELKKMLTQIVQPESDFLDIKGAAKFLHTSPAGLRQRMTRIEIPHMKIRSRLYFSRADLTRFVESYRVVTDAEIEADLINVFKTKNK